VLVVSSQLVITGCFAANCPDRPRQLGTSCLPRCVPRTSLLELLDHAIEIGIAGSKAPCEPVPTALGNPLAVSDHVELAGLPRRNDSLNVEALLEEGRETRDLGVVVLSCRAVNDLDLHLFSNLLRVATEWLMVSCTRLGPEDSQEKVTAKICSQIT
jgi:hypothetical protein